MGWFRRRRADPAAVVVAEAPRQQEQGFTWVGGRRMIADMPYVLPKDLGEINRLDFQHYLYRAGLRSNFAAPIAGPDGRTLPQSILDVGTGSGRWAIEMAEQFPDANVVAVDLVDPAESGSRSHVAQRFPENYTFVTGDVLEGLPFAEQTFDFVHQRLLYAAVPLVRWQWVVYELCRVTRPGGWVELVEGGLLHGPGPNAQAVTAWAVEMCDRRGIDVRIGPRLDAFLREARLLNVASREVVLPVGQRQGHLGRLAEINLLNMYRGLRGPILAARIVDAQTYDQALAAMPYEFAQAPHVFPFYVAYGQRTRPSGGRFAASPSLPPWEQ